jgi:endoglucanase
MPGLSLSLRRFRILRRTLPCALAAALMAVLFSPACAGAAPAFPLHTAGQSIVDSNGVRVHLNAFNWYGAESSDFVVAGLELAPLPSIVSEIKSLGFNAVRLPWSNQLVETNPVVGSYALTANPAMVGENALSILDQVIAALTNAGIMVILDNHNSNAEWCCSTSDGNSLWYNSQYPQTNWIADWQTMVARYQGNPWVIGADLRNEPRSPATWGGSAADDWHAAAELGGNAVLSVNPNLLIFVEGVNYAGDLSGVAALPVQLNVANQLVYEAHDYGDWYSASTLTSYSAYVNTITPKWGYLVTGSNPQPFWIGEFGTCNTANTCVASSSNGDNGYWFSMFTSYVEQNSLDWSYWAINGTQSTGNTRTYGAVETYGVLNAAWNGAALASLAARLESMMAPASANFSMIPGGSALSVSPGGSVSATVTIIPENGFSGTVNLSCTVSGPSGAANLPTCSVPATQPISGTGAANVSVSITTTGSSAQNHSGGERSSRRAGAILACIGLFAGSLLRRSRKSLMLVVLLFLAAVPLMACGGGGGSGGSGGSLGTTAGAYTVTVTGTATGVNAVTAQVSLTVQ